METCQGRSAPSAWKCWFLCKHQGPGGATTTPDSRAFSKRPLCMKQHCLPTPESVLFSQLPGTSRGTICSRSPWPKPLVSTDTEHREVEVRSGCGGNCGALPSCFLPPATPWAPEKGHTWWRCPGWGARCPPGHTSSSPWRGGIAPACTGHRAHTRGSPHCRSWAAGPPPGPTAAPGHTRTLE